MLFRPHHSPYKQHRPAVLGVDPAALLWIFLFFVGLYCILIHNAPPAKTFTPTPSYLLPAEPQHTEDPVR
ncbi:MAG: hypothetical protein ACFB9N_15000 [Geitlerinemataceae cyanobacterium]